MGREAYTDRHNSYSKSTHGQYSLDDVATHTIVQKSRKPAQRTTYHTDLRAQNLADG